MSSPSVPFHAVGDAVAARTAVMAIYEGRKIGMAI